MEHIFSNGSERDFVIKPLSALAAGTTRLFIAAPYVTKVDTLIEAAKSGKRVDLIVGLNPVTSPKALAAVTSEPNIEVRYYCHHPFHAKIYVFDTAAMLGSSNLTDGGLQANREATIMLNHEHDSDAIEELRSLFNELWQQAEVLTTDVLRRFTEEYNKLPQLNIEDRLQRIVGVVEPPNINVDSRKHKPERIFLEGLRSRLSLYRNAFNEVTSVLAANGLRRTELKGLGDANQAGRFLAWVRHTHAPGDDWESIPPRSQASRQDEILRLGREWAKPRGDDIPQDYISSLNSVMKTFGSAQDMDIASKDQLSEGLLSLHAFYDQRRFVKDGNLKEEFWAKNENDTEKIRNSLKELIHGTGDFVARLHDFLYSSPRQVKRFGIACALELYGATKSDYPSINGRVVKGLRYLGFNVPPL